MARSTALHPSRYLIFASFFWASGTLLSKQLLTAIPPVMFLVIQLAPSVVLLWLIVLATRMQTVKRNNLPAVLILAFSILASHTR